MCQNPHNAIIHLGHHNGTVTLWSPNQKEALVKMLCHQGAVRSVAVDKAGTWVTHKLQILQVGQCSRTKFLCINTFLKHCMCRQIQIQFAPPQKHSFCCVSSNLHPFTSPPQYNLLSCSPIFAATWWLQAWIKSWRSMTLEPSSHSNPTSFPLELLACHWAREGCCLQRQATLFRLVAIQHCASWGFSFTHFIKWCRYANCLFVGVQRCVEYSGN